MVLHGVRSATGFLNNKSKRQYIHVHVPTEKKTKVTKLQCRTVTLLFLYQLCMETARACLLTRTLEVCSSDVGRAGDGTGLRVVGDTATPSSSPSTAATAAVTVIMSQ